MQESRWFHLLGLPHQLRQQPLVLTNWGRDQSLDFEIQTRYSLPSYLGQRQPPRAARHTRQFTELPSTPRYSSVSACIDRGLAGLWDFVAHLAKLAGLERLCRVAVSNTYPFMTLQVRKGCSRGHVRRNGEVPTLRFGFGSRGINTHCRAASIDSLDLKLPDKSASVPLKYPLHHAPHQCFASQFTLSEPGRCRGLGSPAENH